MAGGEGNGRYRRAGAGVVSHRNPGGDAFDTPVGEILTDVALHAQYHRGKVNLLLRQAGLTPIALNYIGFIRGEPAAITPPK